MKTNLGTLVALAAITAKAAVPTAALAQEIANITQQCDFIDEIRNDRNALQRELDMLLGNSPDALSCRFETTPELRQSCEDQCINLIVALLGDPVAEIPGPVDPY